MRIGYWCTTVRCCFAYPPQVAIIGGSGFYTMDGIREAVHVKVSTRISCELMYKSFALLTDVPLKNRKIRPMAYGTVFSNY